MKTMKPKIVCIHLLNDFSGSPLVFSQAIKALIDKGHEIDIHTSKSETEGFLSNLAGAKYLYFKYQWSKIKFLTLVKFVISQLILFFKLLSYRKQNVVFYINTVLPFGAALAGFVLQKKVIYHMHETSVKPVILKKILFAITNRVAYRIIYVSEFLSKQEPLSKPKATTIPNALSKTFIEQSKSFMPEHSKQFTVLMLASLKAYKGINEFVSLAEALPNIKFIMVLNAQQSELDSYFSETEIPKNLSLFPVQRNVHPFYQRAHLVLNLSHPDQWVETFGMTALEAMSYGLPIIVPPVGGIAELAIDGFNGFKIDVRKQVEIMDKIKMLSENQERYKKMSMQAKCTAVNYSPELFSLQIQKAIVA